VDTRTYWVAELVLSGGLHGLVDWQALAGVFRNHFLDSRFQRRQTALGNRQLENIWRYLTHAFA